MSVLAFDGIDDQVVFTPISAALANLPNGAGTLVALVRVGDQGDICGLLDSADSGWYHVLGNQSGPARLTDDDGLASPSATTAFATQTAGAGNYQIVVVDWPAGGAALERFHWSSLVGTAESWTHDPSSANNGGNRAGPGTTGRFRIAGGSSQGPLLGEVALVAAWAGVRFTDTNVTDLWVNKKTSDWWNHSAGPPTLLTELNTLTPVDIGSAPSTLSTVIGATLTGADPTGWAFDGRGDAAPASPPASPLLSMLRRGGLPRAQALRLLHPPVAAEPTIALSDADSATGSETSDVQATVPGSDSSTGSEAGTVSATVSDADSGAGTDAQVSIVVPVAGTESGTGTDTGSVAATVPGSDSATGTDGGVVTETGAGGEGGAGFDTGTVSVTASGADTGAGTDSGTVVDITGGPDVISGSDSGSGSESGSVSVTAAGADSGGGSEVGTVVDLTPAPPVVDAGPSGGTRVVDTDYGDETAIFPVEERRVLADADFAVGAEAGVVVDLTPPRPFRLRVRLPRFTAPEPVPEPVETFRAVFDGDGGAALDQQALHASVAGGDGAVGSESGDMQDLSEGAAEEMQVLALLGVL